jgi:uncharacterized circularly permuted ATP-grasp superfamily protein/uncharacterized alpha-E superfamily protein
MSNCVETNELSRLRKLLPNYLTIPGQFDELFCASPSQLARWERLLTGEPSTESDSSFHTASHVRERWNWVKKNLVEHTGTSTERDSHRNAEVDPIPLLFEEKEWSVLARGIAQRAKLLDLLLKDIYGPQNVLARGLIPTHLVFGHNGFLNPMRGAIDPNRSMLSLYAVQLCRDSEGKWYATADRTQGPSGAGYSVENRLSISSVLPTEFREMLVQRSAPFFATLCDSMNRNAVFTNEPSWMVLLSPGSKSSAYFEDAYLARYLGYTLAQAEDLTVRGGQVFMKTLVGLRRVSNILRRISDSECDPLELSASAVGVPGLCQAVRDHQVAIENQLGSGWAEQPVLHKFLPLLCQELLGEDLLLPSWPTRWCGDQEDWSFVRDNIEYLQVRSAFKKEKERKPTALTTEPMRLNGASLLKQIEQAPFEYVASFPYPSVTAPCFHQGEIVSWPYRLRVFATAVENGEYQVLSSGIARTGSTANRVGDTLTSGRMSKDVWVLGEAPVPLMSLLKPPQMAMEVRRLSFDLPSRVAENLHWLGRWTARAEGTVRHLRFCAQRLSAERDIDTVPVLAEVVASVDRESERADAFRALQPTHEQISRKIVEFSLEGGHLWTLPNALVGIVRNMNELRDRMSRDSWQFLSRMDPAGFIGKTKPEFADVSPALNQLLTHLTAFSGLVAESMTRGPGWLFLDIGRRIERIQQQIHLVEKLMVPVHSRLTPLLLAMLEIMDSSITYRYRYLMNIELGPVLDLLLLDQTNPRSMIYQFIELDEHLSLLTTVDHDAITHQRNQIQQCREMLQLFDVKDLTFATGSLRDPSHDKSHLPRQIRHEIAKFMAECSVAINGLEEYLGKRFFTHTHAYRRGEVENKE